MIWNDAQSVLFNGTEVQSVLCNGVVIWQSAGLRGSIAKNEDDTDLSSKETSYDVR